MDVTSLLRPNIRKLEPYRCARDDYKVGVLLDANENTHAPAVHDLSTAEESHELNRYPDPHQIEVKQLACDWRNKQAEQNGFSPSLRPENLYLGVGSDECIDTLIRALCTPGTDKMLICPPTYGMYTVSANINDVELVKVPLTPDFELDADAVLEALKKDKSIKLLYVCSPGNPTAKQVKTAYIKKILENWKGGVVAVDEAYVDFTKLSLTPLVNEYDHLVVLQTLSKSFGLAGLRCGLCWASAPLARAFNSMKAPYNISSLTSSLALRALSPKSIAKMEEIVAKIISERDRLAVELPKIPSVGKIIGGMDANFILVQILNKPNGTPSSPRAKEIYTKLAEKKNVVVRFRGSELNCEGCLRISVGTPEENEILLRELKEALSS